ncbi:MAG: TetR/AcrR family transcriptional regulator [Rhizobiaceae bacterium]
MTVSPHPQARDKLLDAAIAVVRAKGFNAASVDDLCKAAGVTKGAFFHHFPSKESLGVEAARHWSQMTGALFASAAYHQPSDPLDRVLAYIDFRMAILDGKPSEFTCYAGTTVQETFDQSTPIREACRDAIFDHAATLEADIGEAMKIHGVEESDARSLALYTQAVLQGAFILAKADNGPEIARQMVGHLRRYFELLFKVEGTDRKTS